MISLFKTTKDMEMKEKKFDGMVMNGFLMLFVNLMMYVATMAVAIYGIVLLAEENGCVSACWLSLPTSFVRADS